SVSSMTRSRAWAISGTSAKSPSTTMAPTIPLATDIGRAAEMRMVPVGAARVVRGQRDLDVVALPRLHQPHDVVGDAARAAVRAVEMEVRVVELVRIGGNAGHSIAVGRQVVDEPDLQGLAGLHAQRRGQPAFVAAQVEAKAADVAIGVGAAQAGAQLA